MLRLQNFATPAADGVAVKVLPMLPPLEGAETPEQVDLFAAAVRAALEKPTPALGPALRALLERTDLAHLRMTDGHLLRSVLLAAQQQLGFPWALEIAPEDLALLQPPPRHLRLRSAIVASAVGSSVWALWLVLRLSGPPRSTLMLLSAALLVSVAHAVASALEAVAFRSAKHLRRVARAWLVVPVLLAAALLADDSGRERGLFFFVGVVSVPSLLTAGLVRVLARRRAVQ